MPKKAAVAFPPCAFLPKLKKTIKYKERGKVWAHISVDVGPSHFRELEDQIITV